MGAVLIQLRQADPLTVLGFLHVHQMLARRTLRSGSLRTTLRCTGIDTCGGSRSFSSRFTKTKKRVEVLEKEAGRGQQSIFDAPQQRVSSASA